MTTKNRTDSRIARKAIHIRSPARRFVVPTGVLSAAWYVFSHMILPRIGQADSKLAAIMA